MNADAARCLSSRLIHDGRIVRLSMDRVRFPDGSTGELEMIRHSGASAVVPVRDPSSADPTVILLRQFRYAAGGDLWEIPAGRPDDPDEPWDLCARRELEEETGLRAGHLTPLTVIHTTPGFTDERIHLFLATELQPGAVARDTDEFIEVEDIRMSEALRMIESGRITDAKTICGLMYAAMFTRCRSPGAAGS